MILSSSKLLLITAIFYNQTHAKSLCSLHILEDVSQNGISVNVEKICFNELITQLLKLIITAEGSHFSRVKENFTLGNANVCSESAKGLTLQAAKELQQNGIKERIYLSLKYVNSELLTYDHESTNALLLHGDEIITLLKNYKITEIESAQNS